MELLERNEHLATLEQALVEARAEGGRMVLVSGEAGIGKSALVEQFTRGRLGTERILWGLCDDLFTPRPLGPLHDLASQTRGELPSLLARPDDRSAIFNAVMDELRAPIIVVIEDIHWADEATLDLLRFVGRRMSRTRALLITTFRDGHAAEARPLKTLLGDLSRQATTRRLALEPLSEAAIAALAGSREIDAGTLHRLTGGNPFFLREVLAHDGTGIPMSIRDAVLARVSRLTLSGKAVLEAAAVVGPRVEPWLLETVVQSEAAMVIESLQTRLLHDGPNGYTFRHDLVRQTILEAMPPHRRRFWHRAILDALRGSSGAVGDIARLAHHAAGTNDGEAILRYARAAGEEAAALGMHRAASTWFELVAPYADALPPGERIDLFEKIGLNYQAQDLHRARDAFAKVADLARAAGDPVREALAWARMAVIHYRLGELADCDRLLAEVVTLAEPLAPNRALVAAYPLIAMRQLLQGEGQAAVDFAEKGHQMALALEKIEGILQAYQVVGLCTMPINHAQGLEHLAAGLRLALENGQTRMAGTLFANLIMHTLDTYDTVRVEALLSEAVPYMVEHDLDFNLAMARAWEAMLRLHQGRGDDCERLAEAVLENRPAPIARIPALVALARLHARRGAFGPAEQRLAEAEALSKKINNRQRIGIFYCAAAEAAWLQGDHDRVRALGAEFFETAVHNRLTGFGGEMAAWLFRVGEPVGSFDWMVVPFVLEIEGDWRSSAAAWGALDCPYERAMALAGGGPEALKEALLLFERLGARPMIERVRHDLRAAGIQSLPRSPRSETRKNPYGLTRRQIDVLRLLVEHLTNAEIAARLHISPKTVDHHVSAVLGKMGVASREEAAARARSELDT